MTNKKTQIPSVKAFVNDQAMASISCPACGIVRTISVKKFKHKQHVLNVKCKCQLQFKAHLEFRKQFRKVTELDGLYVIQPPDAGGGRIKIKNISRSGIGFAVSGVHPIKLGQEARIKFVLDNRKATELDKYVTIMSIKGNYIGCQFVENQAFEKELGFYLRP